MKVKDWKQIVQVGDNAAVAREKLAELVVGNKHALDDADLDFIDSQEYITAVPVELALTTHDRNILMENHPECRLIVTGVTKESAERLANDYGYTVHVTIKKKKSEKVPESKPFEMKVRYIVGGKAVEVEIDDPSKIDEALDKLIKSAVKLLK